MAAVARRVRPARWSTRSGPSGGEAVANGADVADWEQADAMVQQAIDTFGVLDVVVNNAGFLRDRMLANTSRGRVGRGDPRAPQGSLRAARVTPSRHWRERTKAGDEVQARIINTSSGAGLMGSVGQGNYSAAKAGIAALTLVAVRRVGPLRRDRERDRAGRAHAHDRGSVRRRRWPRPTRASSTRWRPRTCRRLVVWLGSVDSAGVTGRVFEVEGGKLSVVRRLAARRGRRQGRAVGAARDRSGACVTCSTGTATGARLRRHLTNLQRKRAPGRAFALQVRAVGRRGSQLRRSTIMAMPWPPPTHIDSRPNVLSASWSPWISVVMMRAPVMPKG